MKSIRESYVISVSIFIMSLSVVVYASYQIIYSKNLVKNNIKSWDTITKKKENSDKEQICKPQENIHKSEDSYNKAEIIGKLTIERTKKVLPIVEGTNEENLENGAGHYKSSSLPGHKGNCIIFGHRDGVFSNLEEIKLDDIISIETNEGRFDYKVTAVKITEPKEEKIIKEYQDSILTLVTCYPFRYIGSAPKRFIVIAIKNDK